jgi:hypothetical protein
MSGRYTARSLHLTPGHVIHIRVRYKTYFLFQKPVLSHTSTIILTLISKFEGQTFHLWIIIFLVSSWLFLSDSATCNNLGHNLITLSVNLKFWLVPSWITVSELDVDAQNTKGSKLHYEPEDISRILRKLVHIKTKLIVLV